MLGGMAALVELAADPARLVEGMNRAAVSVNQAVDRMTQAARQAAQRFNDDFDRINESANRIGEGMKNAGEKMTVASLPLIALGAAGVQAALEIDSASTQIQRALGATAEEAEAMTEITKNVFKQGWGDSLEDVNNALVTTKLNLQDMVSEADLQPLVEDAMALRKTFDAEVNESTRTASVLMKNFGIDGQQAMDMIAYGFQHGGNYSDELLDTLREYSPQFAALGFNAGQAMSILTAGAEAGAWNLDKVGDAIKEFNIRAKDASDTSALAFQQLGLDAEEMTTKFAAGGEEAQAAFAMVTAALANVDDEVTRNAIGVGLFGTQYEDLEKTVVQAMGNAAQSVTDFSGAMDSVKGEMSNAELLTAAWRDVTITLGEALQPIIDGLVNSLVPAVQNMAAWFGQLNPGIQQAALMVGALAIATGPLLVALGSIISVLPKLVTGWKAVTGLFTLATGPVGIAVAAIAGLIAIGVLLYKNWDEIKAFLSGIWESIKTTAVNVWNSIIDFFKQWGTLMLAVLTGPIGLLVYAIAKYWDDIKKTAEKMWEAITDWIVDKFKWLYDHNYYFKDLVDFISETWDNLKKLTENVWNTITNWLKSKWDFIKSTASSIWNSIYSSISNIFGNIQSKIQGVWNSIASYTSSKWGSIKSTISGIANSIQSILNGLASKAWNWGRNLLGEFIDGVKSKISALMSILKDAADAAADFLGFHSPTKKGPGRFADEWAPNLMDMFIGGIKDHIPKLGSTSEKAAGSLKRGMTSSGGAAVAGTPIIIKQMIVREEADITKIARKLYMLQQGKKRSAGVK